MSSSRAGRPWTKGKGSGGGRPLTRGRQRGYYSEIVGADAVQRLGVSDEVRSRLCDHVCIGLSKATPLAS